MSRLFGGRTTCESCISIDVRRWHRERKLDAGLSFSCSCTYGGEPSGSISVSTEVDAVVLMYRGSKLEGYRMEVRPPTCAN
jgi:hypothetical protein